MLQASYAPGQPAGLTDLMTKLCHERDILNVRAVCRDFNELCEPIIYRFLVQEILTRRHFHLHRAVSSRRMNLILRLIEDGAPVTQRNAEGETPLHIASRNGYLAGVETLISCNKDLDMPTSHGWTALQLTARYGHDEVMAIFLQNGADPDIHGFHGWTALHYATRTGHQKAVELLIGAGARVDILDNDQISPIHLAQTAGQRKILDIFNAAILCTI